MPSSAVRTTLRPPRGTPNSARRTLRTYGKLDTDDSSVSNLAEKMLKQAAVLRAQAAAEREEGAA